MEGGGHYPPGSYQNNDFDGGQGMYNNAPQYRRVASPPGMDPRVSPPTQYVSGSFPPPQMYQRHGGYAGQADVMSKGITPSKMMKKLSGMISQIPWRYLCFCLIFLNTYFFMQWKMCANGLSFPDSRSPSTSPTKASDSSVNFADLKSSVSGITGASQASTETETVDSSLQDAADTVQADPSENEMRTELRRLAIEPPSYSAASLLQQPFASRIIVSEKAKVMYCPVPKAANSNWKYLIRKYEGFEDYTDLAKAHDRSQSGLKYLQDFNADSLTALLNDPTILKFTFVRDPFSRTLSCYLNKFNSKEKDGEEYKVYMAQLYGWVWVKEHDLVSEPRPTFKEFVDLISTQAWTDMNEHWAPQSWLCGIGEFPYDFVGKLEEVGDYAPKIIGWMAGGSEAHFPSQDEIKFASVGTNERVNEYYDESVRERVRGTFQNDFDLLKYAK